MQVSQETVNAFLYPLLPPEQINIFIFVYLCNSSANQLASEYYIVAKPHPPCLLLSSFVVRILIIFLYFFTRSFPGRCSGDQLKALEEFRNYAIQAKVYKQVIDPVSTPQGQIGDEFLLRFLRARKFDMEKTILMFKNFLIWRHQNHVDTVLTDFVYQELVDVRTFYPHGYYHTDREVRPARKPFVLTTGLPHGVAMERIPENYSLR